MVEAATQLRLSSKAHFSLSDLLLETHDPQQREGQDSEAEGPDEEVDQRVQVPTWKS